jgi:hypothetical protein
MRLHDGSLKTNLTAWIGCLQIGWWLRLSERGMMLIPLSENLAERKKNGKIFGRY